MKFIYLLFNFYLLNCNIIIESSIINETKFDWQFYLKYNPDIVKAGIVTRDRAYEHYQNYGKNRFY